MRCCLHVIKLLLPNIFMEPYTRTSILNKLISVFIIVLHPMYHLRNPISENSKINFVSTHNVDFTIIFFDKYNC